MVASVEEAARRVEDDQKLLERLIDIRSSTVDDIDWSATDAAYAAAFREAGIDLAALPPAEAGARIKARPARIALTLSAALDDWARVRRDKRRDRPGAERVAQAARAADPDPWRCRLRDALDASPGQERLEAPAQGWPDRPGSRNCPPSASTCWAWPCARPVMRRRPRSCCAGAAPPSRRRLAQLQPGHLPGEAGAGGRKRSVTSWRPVRAGRRLPMSSRMPSTPAANRMRRSRPSGNWRGSGRAMGGT